MKKIIFTSIALLIPAILLFLIEVTFRFYVSFSSKELIPHPSLISARFNQKSGIPDITKDGFISHRPKSSKASIFVVGDSVPASYGREKMNFPSLLSDTLNSTVDNFSIPGSNLDHYEYIVTSFISNGYDLGVISICINDIEHSARIRLYRKCPYLLRLLSQFTFVTFLREKLKFFTNMKAVDIHSKEGENIPGALVGRANTSYEKLIWNLYLDEGNRREFNERLKSIIKIALLRANRVFVVLLPSRDMFVDPLEPSKWKEVIQIKDSNRMKLIDIKQCLAGRIPFPRDPKDWFSDAIHPTRKFHRVIALEIAGEYQNLIRSNPAHVKENQIIIGSP